MIVMRLTEKALSYVVMCPSNGLSPHFLGPFLSYYMGGSC